MEVDLEGDDKGDFRGEFKQDLEGDLTVKFRSGKVQVKSSQVWYSSGSVKSSILILLSLTLK